jgi:hypothetical protein
MRQRWFPSLAGMLMTLPEALALVDLRRNPDVARYEPQECHHPDRGSCQRAAVIPGLPSQEGSRHGFGMTLASGQATDPDSHR